MFLLTNMIIIPNRSLKANGGGYYGVRELSRTYEQRLL
jgi:hypothetical protein